MNQVLRQNSKMSVQNYFTNLRIMRILAMIVPTTLATAPLHRYLMRYAKQFQNIFDQNSSEFASSELLEKQIEEKFSNKVCSSINIMNISKLEKIIWSCKKKELDMVSSMKRFRKIKHDKNTKKNI